MVSVVGHERVAWFSEWKQRRRCRVAAVVVCQRSRCGTSWPSCLPFWLNYLGRSEVAELFTSDLDNDQATATVTQDAAATARLDELVATRAVTTITRTKATPVHSTRITCPDGTACTASGVSKMTAAGK